MAVLEEAETVVAVSAGNHAGENQHCRQTSAEIRGVWLCNKSGGNRCLRQVRAAVRHSLRFQHSQRSTYRKAGRLGAGPARVGPHSGTQASWLYGVTGPEVSL